ncbi:MAG: biotin--[acetyl-CoA-carboxylase] ligase [Candidatus Nanopelagicales bacterium]
MSQGPDPENGRRPLADVGPLLAADARWAGWPTPIHVDSTPSTMAEVEARAAQGGLEGTCIVAEEQTQGRGRSGRSWESAAQAGLWLSVLLRPTCAPSQLGWLPLVIGTAVARALRDVAGVDAVLKWPNDVVAVRPGGIVKLGGILAERLSDGSVVVGVGINVDHGEAELPDGGASLRTLGSSIPREDVLVAVLGGIAEAYRRWCTGGDPAPAYRDLCITLGRRIRAQRPTGTLVGQATGLGPGGELIVVDDDGAEHVISAGDISLVRPEPDADMAG